MTGIGFGCAIDGLRQLADGVRTDAVSRAHRANPELVITWDQPAYSPATAPVSASETADTMVVGARGMSAARGVLMGSVSVQVAAHAYCPVVIAHNAPAQAVWAPVVVGVDGSASSTNAIAYAFEQASSRGVGLTVVHAWWLDYVEGAAASAIWTVDWQTLAQKEQTLVAESLAGWQEMYPDGAVRTQNMRGLPVKTLIRQSKNARLVVVGNRGRGGFTGLLLGSGSQGVVTRAQCPVAIVHRPKEPQNDRHNTDTSHPHMLPLRRCTNIREHEPESAATRTPRTPWSPH